MEYRIQCDYCIENGNGVVIIRCLNAADRDDILDFLLGKYPDSIFISADL